MSSIYLHIPFCHQKCHYCNFFSVASNRMMQGFADALCLEAELRKEYIVSEPVQTVYFGGGTPSMLPLSDIEKILHCLHDHYTMAENAEITLEANPEDLNREKLMAFNAMGINRLSMGIQSFHDTDLQYLHRTHDAKQAVSAIELALECGFQNLSLDLIYGIPTLDMDKWMENLGRIAMYRIPHLSAYALTVEPNTILHWRILHKKTSAIEEEAQAEQFLALMKWAKENGYEHYEISNFCYPGKESVHNSKYWNGSKYLGLGPSAHSFNGLSRQWNIAQLQAYMNGVREGNMLFEKEVLTNTDMHNEYVMTSLRTSLGIDLQFYHKLFGEIALTQLRKNIHVFVEKGWIKVLDKRVILTNQGKLFADRIAASLFQL